MSQVTKVNRFNKVTDRLLVVSEKKLYKLDTKKCKLMRGEDLSDVAGVYTFGSPRVGNTEYAKHYRVPHFRVVHNNDLVAMVPPPLVYQHTGKMIFIDAEGRVSERPAFMKQVKSQFKGHLKHAKRYFKRVTAGQLKSVPNGNLADHAPLYYVVYLWRALQSAQKPTE